MTKVVTMGEIMLRLSAPNFKRFEQTESFDVHYGGGEANVAVFLANLGMKSQFITKLPDNSIGNAAINELRRYGVNTDKIVRAGERIGIYFLEPGVSMRQSKVIYDRKNSAFSQAQDSDFDFDAIFKDADWFHITGITPALSDDAAKLTKTALMAAKKHGVTVSCDLNYRKKLWGPEKAREVMSELLPFADICIGGRKHMGVMLGLKLKHSDVTENEPDLEEYQNIFNQMKKKYGFKYIVSSLRESVSASDNSYGVLLYDGDTLYQTQKYDIRIVDRIGGGDAFAAGFIYALLNKMEWKEAGEFGVAAAALKHTIPGDMNLVTKEEIMNLMKGDSSGRVQR